MRTEAIFSAKSDHWSTPSHVYEDLNKEFLFDYDPCPLQSDDITSLLKEWRGAVFINPPYSNIYNFIEKGLIELKKGNATVCVYLLPSRTGTKWWHDHVIPYAKEVRFIRGRLKFGGSNTNAPFDSVIVIFGGQNEA